MMLDVIVLSYAKDDAHFEMVKKCVDSYLKDGSEYINKIILVESNKDFDLSVWKRISDKVQTICPPYKFNYNHFLNIALDYCESEMICITNSDVVVKENCIKNILSEFEKDPDLMSASPVDRTWHQNSYRIFPEDNKVYYGYQTTMYLLGFNLYMRKSVYDIIGKYDERFDFYHQDNDYEMCLKSNKLKHAMITSAHIVHGEDKADTGVTHEETRAKLVRSAGLFSNKWNRFPFKKYVKLGIITEQEYVPTNDLVKVYKSNDIHPYGEYLFRANMKVTEDLVNKILEKINIVRPSKIEIDENNSVVKYF